MLFCGFPPTSSRHLREQTSLMLSQHAQRGFVYALWLQPRSSAIKAASERFVALCTFFRPLASPMMLNYFQSAEHLFKQHSKNYNFFYIFLAASVSLSLSCWS
ncbi:unnamed protein product [Ceratitis capitata]|uniref:(Mediterranean fruit fly) hypothetical protein n=1 Tax=Ceratitis capitata TaxID=7213 RepID=A0A811VCF0_CERCA|nr:unnamed protein product [Ceratitis capitata]